jgi:DNA helicase-2/ATP-dependent DNA helicase PcrA
MFTDEQRAIIEHDGVHALVSAVAGAGKTSTLKGRIEFLLEKGVAPKRILVLMYNRDIKEEFQRYYKNRTGTQSPRIETFHSLGKSILEQYAYRNKSAIHRLVNDDYRQQQILKKAYYESREGIDNEAKIFESEEFKKFSELVALWKVDGYSPQDIANNLEFDDIDTRIKSAYHNYEILRQEQRIRFLEDLIYDTLPIIESEKHWIENHFDHILVDEYQDINQSQQKLLKAIAGSRARVMVVGDPDQCIYQWRGSRPDFILGLFEREFGDVQRYCLSQTFRFGHRISLIANACIRHNKKRLKSICLSAPGTPSTEAFHQMSEDDAHVVLAILKEICSSGIPLSKIGLLVRAYGHAVGVELMLLREGITYNHGASKKLCDRDEVQMLACLLSFAWCGSLQAIVPAYRQRAFRTLLRLSKLYFTKQELDICSLAVTDEHFEWDVALKQRALEVLTDPKKLVSLDNQITQWKNLKSNIEVADDAYQTLLRIQYLCPVEDLWEETASRHKDANDKKRSFQSLMNCIRGMGITCEGLLQLFFKSTDENNAETLTITSIHKAKGLEWRVVIILGLSEGEFPVATDYEQSQRELEEERRLFYVAVTRAKEKLYLISPVDSELIDWQNKGWYGAPKQKRIIASRFLYEADIKKSNEIGMLLDNRQVRDVKVGEKDYLIKNYLSSLRKISLSSTS